jgi:hypothetical protein
MMLFSVGFIFRNEDVPKNAYARAPLLQSEYEMLFSVGFILHNDDVPKNRLLLSFINLWFKASKSPSKASINSFQNFSMH